MSANWKSLWIVEIDYRHYYHPSNVINKSRVKWEMIRRRNRLSPSKTLLRTYQFINCQSKSHFYHLRRVRCRKKTTFNNFHLINILMAYLSDASQKRVSYQHIHFLKFIIKLILFDFISFFKYHTNSLALTNRDYTLMSKNI